MSSKKGGHSSNVFSAKREKLSRIFGTDSDTVFGLLSVTYRVSVDLEFFAFPFVYLKLLKYEVGAL